MLWRHGQTVWNFEDRFQGQTDIPLNETGVSQAERAARLLAALQPDAIFCSDLGRAAATAAPLARITGLPVTVDKDLRERHGGVWEGLTGPEIRARYPAEFQNLVPARRGDHRRRRGPGVHGAGAHRGQPAPGFAGRDRQPRCGDPAWHVEVSGAA